MDQAIARGLAYAPYADVVWCETSDPDLEEAARFAGAIREQFPDKLLAYNCSPSFNWKLHLDDEELAGFQHELARMGYKLQYVTPAGFHALNMSMFELAHAYRDAGMLAYSCLQEREFVLQRDHGYSAVKHQAFVGAGYFDEVMQTVAGGRASTTAITGSTEEQQFTQPTPAFLEAEIHHTGGGNGAERLEPNTEIVENP
jgi:isocitrate lyase